MSAVYRFFDTATKDHLFTTSNSERDQIMKTSASFDRMSMALPRHTMSHCIQAPVRRAASIASRTRKASRSRERCQSAHEEPSAKQETGFARRGRGPPTEAG